MLRNTVFYWRKYGLLSLIIRVCQKLSYIINSKGKQASAFVYSKNGRLIPIQIFSCPEQIRRVNLVLESEISNKSGMDVAVLFAVMLANKWDYELRIISIDETNKNVYHELLKLCGVLFQKNVDFISINSDSKDKGVEISNSDLFITTSWLTTHKVIGSINEKKVIYLVMEDDGLMSQEYGDRFICMEDLRNQHLNYIISTRKLYEKFISEGFYNIRNKGVWIEPEFSINTLVNRNIMTQAWNETFGKISAFLDRVKSDVSA